MFEKTDPLQVAKTRLQTEMSDYRKAVVNALPDANIFKSSELKDFADDKFAVTELWWKWCLEKEKMRTYKHFLPFPSTLCLKKPIFFLRILKTRVKIYLGLKCLPLDLHLWEFIRVY